MMAVPVLIFHDVVDIVLVIGPETEGAEFALAFVVNALRILLNTIEALVKIGEKSLEVGS